MNVTTEGYKGAFEIQQLCENCKKFKPAHDVFMLKASAKHACVCVGCLAAREWRYLKKHVRVDDYPVVMVTKLGNEGGFVKDKPKPPKKGSAS